MQPVIKNICKHTDIVFWQMVDIYCTGLHFIEPTGFYLVQMFSDTDVLTQRYLATPRCPTTGFCSEVVTVEPKRGSTVPVLIWDITPCDEGVLDFYEDWPRLYRKETVAAH